MFCILVIIIFYYYYYYCRFYLFCTTILSKLHQSHLVSSHFISKTTSTCDGITKRSCKIVQAAQTTVDELIS